MSRRMLFIISVTIAALALGCASMGVGGAADPSPVLSAVKERGTLRVGMSGNQPPFNAKNKQGEVIGLDADLARAIATSIGVDVKIVERPFGELLSALDGGEVDMVISGMTMTPERNASTAFVGPYFVSGKAILTKTPTLAEADDPDDINAKTIRLTALQGSTSEQFVKKFATDSKYTPSASYDAAVQSVLAGSADALVADYPICILTMFRNPEAELMTISSPFSFEPIGIALPANDPLLINLVANYISLLNGTGLLAELQSQWFDDASWVSELP